MCDNLKCCALVSSIVNFAYSTVKGSAPVAQWSKANSPCFSSPTQSQKCLNVGDVEIILSS